MELKSIKKILKFSFIRFSIVFVLILFIMTVHPLTENQTRGHVCIKYI
jgi:hypothetical protein